MENEIYVVCWFDGNEAIAMAGTRNHQGKVSPLVVQRRSAIPGSIVNGVIAINDENRKIFADLVRCVANLLTTTLHEPYAVRKFYVIAMPRSMRSVATYGEKTLETRRYVREDDINECREVAHSGKPSDCDVISLYENGFDLDGSSCRHATGEMAKRLRLNALSVIVSKRFATDFRMLLPKDDVTLAGILPASVAVAMAVTTPDERINGVLSVHICDSTTLFTLYSNDNVIATCVVPFGQQDVIHDLCNGVCEDKRDRDAIWKKIYDLWDLNPKEPNIRLTDSMGNVLVDAEKAKRMSYEAETRISEIFNIGLDWIHTQVANFDNLIHSVVFSGLVTDKPGFDNFASSLVADIPCRCSNANSILTDDKYEDDVNYIPMLGAMLLADQNCVRVKPVPVVEQPKPAATQKTETKQDDNTDGNSFIRRLLGLDVKDNSNL